MKQPTAADRSVTVATETLETELQTDDAADDLSKRV